MTESKDILGVVNNDEKLSVPTGLENAESKDILDYLFSNNNRLLTTTGASFELPHDTQGLIAYFSGGEIIISRTHRYDGRVLAFLDLLRAQGRKINQPFVRLIQILVPYFLSYF